jgi:predicted Zn-dependent protease
MQNLLKMQKIFLRMLPVFSIASMLFLNSCAVVNPVSGKKQLLVMSEQEEIALGKSSDPQVIAEFGSYDDPKLQAFINEKGQEMVKVSHRPNLPFQFKVVDSDVVNAFALPGGYVYFTRGIMAHFNNEAEFAGVLGHEIGHVTARHGALQQRSQILSGIGLIGVLIAVPGAAQFAEPLSQGMQLLLLKNSRDHESQSDELGVQYSTKIGYDAKEMAEFFSTIDRLSGGPEGRVPNFLSTHPNPLDRFKRVGELADAEQKKTNNFNLAINRDKYLRMIDGIVYGPDPKQGYTLNNVFYHPILKFQFPVPADWQLQNSPQQVAMAPKDGKAAIIFNLAPEKTLREAANKTISQDSLKLVDSQNLTVNGFPAIAMVAEQTTKTQQGTQTLRINIYCIQYDNNIYRFYGMATAADYNTYALTFQNTFKNFRELTDPARINVYPERISIKTVNRTGTLADALKSFGVADKRLEEHAILNGMQQKDQVTAGMLIKVVEKGSK